MGKMLGETVGVSVGKTMGSFEALTDYSEAYAEGREEGLSAKDTTAEVVNKIQELKKIEVLVAGVKLKDEHSIGNEAYVALYLLKGDAVFTVDFSKAEISKEENMLHIIISEPEMELIIDQNKIEKVAEYQRFFLNGNAEEGFDAYLASMNKIESFKKTDKKKGKKEIAVIFTYVIMIVFIIFFMKRHMRSIKMLLKKNIMSVIKFPFT